MIGVVLLSASRQIEQDTPISLRAWWVRQSRASPGGPLVTCYERQWIWLLTGRCWQPSPWTP
jgi:hypothetical protein